ncbi:hypothetical protein GMRT_24854 [Giardia muris]|uniref:Uncharacterized protein n=1 Tax=Giardia muris TaxID=5742 RepID=A0A4Z1SLM2_GIAMU|nr:hypothetical protein GMRT_24854 [Giardia muris]|eukprot:TNJ26556.1 hypothetical protein GMRT_24854 [Giardia muris]
MVDYAPLYKHAHGKMLKTRFTSTRALLQAEVQQYGGAAAELFDTPPADSPAPRYCAVTLFPARYTALNGLPFANVSAGSVVANLGGIDYMETKALQSFGVPQRQ